MSIFSNGLAVILSDIGIVARKLIGCNVNFNFISLVSLKATLITRGKGKIILGRKSAISANSVVSTTEGTIDVGCNCFINRNCMIVSHERISIGDGTTIGPGVYIYDHDHDGHGGYTAKPIRIDKNVWIGAGCIILKGIRIGENSVIGAGSIITADVPPNTCVVQIRNTSLISLEHAE